MASLAGRFLIQVIRGNEDGSILVQTHEVNEQMVREIEELIGTEPVGEYMAPCTIEGFSERVEL